MEQGRRPSGNHWSSEGTPSHYRLKLWQQAVALVSQVYALTSDLPAEERFGLVSQMRRSAISVPSNIAEGAARGSSQEMIRFLKIARGSLMELDTQLAICEELGLVHSPDSVFQPLRKLYGQINNLIGAREARKAK
ncbi:MAG: four helix bundle protein [Wenzhouxiangella sp.]|nr:MAG: four helix bundle protein [Wenzhouxiangella sp.]